MARILYIGDLRKAQTGYGTIGINLCNGLVALGHEVKAIGYMYRGEEHWNNFSIIPCGSMEDAEVMAKNLMVMWKYDVMISAADIPIQIKLIKQLTEERKHMKFIAIAAMENPPLSRKWALGLFPADHIFFLSDVAVQAAKTRGLSNVSRLTVGVNPMNWIPLTAEEKTNAKKVFGIADDEKVILSVATNQERKNWPGHFAAVAGFKELSAQKFKFVGVTQRDTPFGWDLDELAEDCGLLQETMLIEKGIEADQLRILFGVADVFLLVSKAEGLGLPVLEAMSMGVPCVCTDTGAMTELCADGRGYLVPSEYEYIDVFGNCKKVYANTKIASAQLYAALVGTDTKRVVNNAHLYLQQERPVIRMATEMDSIMRSLDEN